MLFLIFCGIPNIGYAWSIKHEYTDKFGKTMGENKVHREGNEVFVDEFYYTEGLYSIGGGRDYSLDIKEFNEYLFYVSQNSNSPFIYVTIQLRSSTDKYGNKQPGRKITIGKVDTKESKKYKDLNHWINEYGFLRMFNKDKGQYDEYVRRKMSEMNNNRGPNFIEIDAYYPTSIK